SARPRSDRMATARRTSKGLAALSAVNNRISFMPAREAHDDCSISSEARFPNMSSRITLLYLRVKVVVMANAGLMSASGVPRERRTEEREMQKREGKRCAMKYRALGFSLLTILVCVAQASAQDAEALRRARPYEPLMADAGARHGVDPRLLWTIAFLETRF